MNEANTTGQYVTDTHLAKRLAAEILAARGLRWELSWTWKRPQTPSQPAMRLVSEWLLKEFGAFTAANPGASAARVNEWKRHLAHGHVWGIALLAKGIIAPVIVAEANERRQQAAYDRAHPVGSQLRARMAASIKQGASGAYIYPGGSLTARPGLARPRESPGPAA